MSGGDGHVVIAGTGVAGFRVARELREAGFGGRLTLAGAEPHLPYDRPPLSKAVLQGRAGPESVALTSDGELTGMGITMLAGRPAVALDPGNQTLELRGGERIGYDQLVIATGADARPLPGPPAPPGTHTLRTLDDALALRAALDHTRDLVIIGGGLIAFEAAEAAAAAGVRTSIIEALDSPLLRSLGPDLGRRVAAIAAGRGVPVRCSSRVAAIEGGERTTAVVLDDGTRLLADAVVAAIGAAPAVGWLRGSGLPAGPDGVRCDAAGAVDPEGRVWAVGDVAAWHDEAAGGPVRREHWTSAVEQARTVARNIAAGTREPCTAVPYFWSDQFGHKIQGVGSHAPDGAGTVIETDVGPVGLFTRDGVLTGAAAVDQPRLIARLRGLVRDRRPVDAALALLPAGAFPAS